MTDHYAIPSTNRAFAIQKSRLSEDERWRRFRSDPGEYKIEDFFPERIPLEPADIAEQQKPSFVRPLFVGLALILLVALVDRLLAPLMIFLGGWSLGSLIALSAAIFFVVYAAAAISAKRPAPKLARVQPDRWRYIMPGWSTCFFTIGDEGLAVDGTHFLYMLEWDDIMEVSENDESLRLRNFSYFDFVVPSRFFGNDRGGDMSWEGFRDSVKKRLSHAQWKYGR